MAGIPESVALKSSASSPGPAGRGSVDPALRVCAPTDGEQRPANPTSRTAQALSPDPVVQGEALVGRLMDRRNDLEPGSRGLTDPRG